MQISYTVCIKIVFLPFVKLDKPGCHCYLTHFVVSYIFALGAGEEFWGGLTLCGAGKWLRFPAVVPEQDGDNNVGLMVCQGLCGDSAGDVGGG